MAIQIWHDGQYKSVDLAQYGADGALSGAYVWRDGAWRTLWERDTGGGGDWDWSDDFTSPTLHERWQIVEGTYSPPGLQDVGVLGPDLGEAFEITVDGHLGGGMIIVAAVSETFEEIEWMQVDALQVSNMAGQAASSPGMPTTLRRADGQWSLLADGQVIVDPSGNALTVPDTHTGPAILVLNAIGATLHRIDYTDLT